ncbi:MAG: glycine C-acetyltransferase [Patescibacteria group bacterium]|jgi:glycine C-acetyltransferase
MDNTTKDGFLSEINTIKENNLYKKERVLETPQGAKIIADGKELLNFCANNYLGLANHPDVVTVAKSSLDQWGYGLSSVRFICGTQSIHKTLENKLSEFLGTEDTILYSSCFDANTGLFETITSKDDVIISDELNHASIIDGVRLSKAERKIFQHMDMDDLETKLKESKDFRRKIIATDGVFSMDGHIADIKSICELAEKYGALVVVDDSHASGFIGKSGKGTPEYYEVANKVDLVTGTLGKALGGASGGFVSGRKEIVDLLRQRSRTYLFSNSLSPLVTATSIAILDIIQKNPSFRETVMDNAKYFRTEMTKIGFDIKEGVHPIVPIMLYEAELAQKMSEDLLAEGIYVIGFYYPVVPQGKARIRVQISAGHTKADLDKAISAFEKVGKKYKII